MWTEKEKKLLKKGKAFGKKMADALVEGLNKGSN